MRNRFFMIPMRSFASARDGNIAIMFAFTGALLFLFTGGAIDFTRYNAVRADVLESLDAAGLAVARLDALNTPEIRNLTQAERDDYLKAYGRQFFNENFKHKNEVKNLTVDFTLTKTKIIPQVAGEMKPLFLPKATTLSMGKATEVMRNMAGNTEVSLVLDITGSMGGQKIDDLKAAADEFIDIIVKANQSPFYSKVAIAPYAAAVNVGSLAVSARGAIAQSVPISNATRTDPIVVTASNHGFQPNQKIRIDNVKGMTKLNGNVYTVKNPTQNTFELYNESGSSEIDGTSSSYKSYKSGGDADCTDAGCPYLRFNKASGGTTVFPITTCTSERSGAQAYTDASPATSLLGRVYAVSYNPCPSATIVPLTNDKTALHATVNSLNAGGSTSGHNGIAWGWYLLSPTFSTLYPAASAPGEYDDEEVSKTAVIMTDGDFNTTYCNGVISKDSGYGSGSSSYKINCDAPNGDSFTQAGKLCAGMKAKGITIYTVGFEINAGSSAEDILKDCASGPSYYYPASDGEALKEAFKTIAGNVVQLHISK